MRRIQLKKIDKIHLPILFVWRSQKRICHLLNSSPPKSLASHLQWFFKMQKNHREAHFGIFMGKSILGMVWLARIHRKTHQAEVRIFLGNRPRRSKGTGSKAIRLVCQKAAGIGISLLSAYCWERNIPAVRAFEKSGFRKSPRKLNRVWKSLGKKVAILRLNYSA